MVSTSALQKLGLVHLLQTAVDASFPPNDLGTISENIEQNNDNYSIKSSAVLPQVWILRAKTPAPLP